MKKILFTIFVCSAVLNFAWAKDWANVRIATEGAYPPFNSVDSSGTPIGFDVDIAYALCKQMQVKCTIVLQDWDGIIPSLLTKKYDAIIASMSITEERKKKVSFSDKYYTTPARFIAPKGKYTGKFSPEGKTIGVQRATIFQDFLEGNFKNVDLKVYGTTEEAFLDIISGRVDAVMADAVPLDDFLKRAEGKKFEFVGQEYTEPKWFGDGQGIAIRKEDKQLLKMFNKALADIRKNGEYKKINDKYFVFDVYGE